MSVVPGTNFNALFLSFFLCVCESNNMQQAGRERKENVSQGYKLNAMERGEKRNLTCHTLEVKVETIT